MTLVDLVTQGAKLAEAAGVPVPLALIRQLMELARPELVVIEAPVVTVEIAPGVDLAGLAQYEGGDA